MFSGRDDADASQWVTAIKTAIQDGRSTVYSCAASSLCLMSVSQFNWVNHDEMECLCWPFDPYLEYLSSAREPLPELAPPPPPSSGIPDDEVRPKTIVHCIYCTRNCKLINLVVSFAKQANNQATISFKNYQTMVDCCTVKDLKLYSINVVT